eukprot:5988764-Pleurochrysis_carterae.AAC.2
MEAQAEGRAGTHICQDRTWLCAQLRVNREMIRGNSASCTSVAATHVLRRVSALPRPVPAGNASSYCSSLSSSSSCLCTRTPILQTSISNWQPPRCAAQDTNGRHGRAHGSALSHRLILLARVHAQTYTSNAIHEHPQA